MTTFRRYARYPLLLLCLLIFTTIYTVKRPTWANNQNVARPQALSSTKASPTELEKDVRTLSEKFIPRDHLHPENLNQVADYITTRWEDAGLTVTEQSFVVNDMTYKNVITHIGPKTSSANTPAKVVIGAHYDAAGELPAADDNASGVAGLIALARQLAHAHAQQPFTYPIELVAYTLEEPPYFGSQHMGSYVHAARAKQQNQRIRYMLSLEMLGYYSDEPSSQYFPSPVLTPFYPNKGNFIAVIGQLDPLRPSLTKRIKTGMMPHTAVPIYSMDAPTIVQGIDFSDHRNYWAHGYPAAMLTDTAFFRNTHYHTPEDTAEKLNYTKMAQVIDGLAAFLVTEQVSEAP